MKRIALMAMAAVTALAPLAAAPASADPWDHHDNGYHNGWRGDDGRRDTPDERDAYRQGRWDANRHNGYTYNGRWNYGPPPAAYYGRPGFSPGYHAWRRGDVAPRYYRDRWAPVDYRYAHLRAPPRGYHWVRDDRGSYLLVGLATGVILSAILNN